MKLYNIVVQNNLSEEPFSFNAVAESIDFDEAQTLAEDYLINDCGYTRSDFDENDLDVLECYVIDEVDGYKVKLVKE